MATQNEDLAMLQLLIHHAQSNLVPRIWKKWLFGQDNMFLAETIAKGTPLAHYLKRIYKEEFYKEYDISNSNCCRSKHKNSDGLEEAKALFELQTQSNDLDLNMSLNTNLLLKMNMDLLILNNKKHFESSENMEKPLLNLTKHYGNPEIQPVAELICLHAIRHYNLDDLSRILHKLPRLTNSHNTLIKCLARIDLKSKTMEPEEVNIGFGGDTPLHIAMKEGFTHIVRVLISKGADTEAKESQYNRTPLHIASLNGSKKIAEILLQGNANPNSRDVLQLTPLHIAARNGLLGIVELLLDYGADKKLKGDNENTPLQEAYICRNRVNREAVITLLKQE